MSLRYKTLVAEEAHTKYILKTTCVTDLEFSVKPIIVYKQIKYLLLISSVLSVRVIFSRYTYKKLFISIILSLNIYSTYLFLIYNLYYQIIS